ncbi:MAG: chloride channel protein [Crocinitomicaceae bacterium]|jgi:chloride channel protein, CIC family|nr:chloride channel protein [Crocinitomicaceae bacterium]MDP4760576.1 chloride channel protein [Crocinitomicaceae bacterium]
MQHWLIRKIETIIKWSQNHLSKKQFVFLSSVLIGFTAGMAAVILKTFVHYIYLAATYEKFSNFRYFYLLLPLIGLILTVFVVKRFLNNKLNKGLSQIHFAIAKRSSILPINQTYDQVVTSSITVGFGGSVGLEAPIVITGAAVGSNYSRKYQLDPRERTLMLACGIAAGIGAAFNAPIAGVLFALEVLLLDISISAFTPLIIAAATGALISKIVLNSQILLSFNLTEDFNFYNVPYYLFFGVFAGVISVYHSKMFLYIESKFPNKSIVSYKKAIVAGLVLATLIFIFPSLFGEGYQSIKFLANKTPENILSNSFFESFKAYPWFVLFVVGVLIFVKSIATALTLGGGGNGGNFAPSLFVGAYFGYFFSRLINLISTVNLPENNFTIVGMAGILSGIYHAPLTAIFLIAEITGGYTLMIPLMLVSSISYAVSKYLEPNSMDTKGIAEKGGMLSSDRDKNVLATMNTSDFIDEKYPVLKPNMSLGDLVEVVSHSTKNCFPVLNQKNEFLGLVWLDDIREIMFKVDVYESVFVNELMVKPKVIIQASFPMDVVMRKFDESGVWLIPVLNDQSFLGFISKSSVFNDYRAKLKMNTIV